MLLDVGTILGGVNTAVKVNLIKWHVIVNISISLFKLNRFMQILILLSPDFGVFASTLFFQCRLLIYHAI